MRSALLFMLTTCLSSVPASAATPKIDRLVFGLELGGHIPSTPSPLTANSDAIELGQLSLPLHEASLAYGVVIDALASELRMRVGYRFARGSLPEGSEVDHEPAQSCAVSAWPIMIGWHLVPLPYRLRPLFGIEAGGSFAKLSYDRAPATPLESERSFSWELRGLAGAHLDLTDQLGVRLHLDGRLAQRVMVDQGPDWVASGWGMTLGLVYQSGIPAKNSVLAPAASDKGELREYQPLSGNRLDRAFELIRRADDAKTRHDYIAAEAAYREAIGMMPRDEETRRNVELPVRLDWAKCLMEIGRSRDAIEVVEQALQIDAAHAGANALLGELRTKVGGTATQ